MESQNNPLLRALMISRGWNDPSPTAADPAAMWAQAIDDYAKSQDPSQSPAWGYGGAFSPTAADPAAMWAQALDDHAQSEVPLQVQASGYGDIPAPSGTDPATLWAQAPDEYAKSQDSSQIQASGYGDVDSSTSAIDRGPHDANLAGPFDPADTSCAALDLGLADPTDAGLLLDISSQNQRIRKAWERQEGRPWPRTADGRNYHVHHITPLADGGTHTLDNIVPMHPDEHIRHHMENGDFQRWGKMAGRAARGVNEAAGILGVLPDILGMFDGRIRTDTPEHFFEDMTGQPPIYGKRDPLIV